ncbi:hypothetical protein GCM10010245_89450 [Streptomyces spectabilis]|nr:hypothetical protein GCM10010245_89450 [Streptomyces spectabilis]
MPDKPSGGATSSTVVQIARQPIEPSTGFAEARGTNPSLAGVKEQGDHSRLSEARSAPCGEYRSQHCLVAAATDTLRTRSPGPNCHVRCADLSRSESGVGTDDRCQFGRRILNHLGGAGFDGTPHDPSSSGDRHAPSPPHRPSDDSSLMNPPTQETF